MSASTPRLIFDSDAIDQALHRMAAEIAASTAKEPLAIVGLLSQGDIIAARLGAILKESGCDVRCGAIDISLYRDDIFKMESRPSLRSSNLPFSTDDMRVILVDDVLYTGRTIRAALNAIFDYGRPARIELACLIDRGGREVPIEPNYVGLTLPPDAKSPKIVVCLNKMKGLVSGADSTGDTVVDAVTYAE